MGHVFKIYAGSLCTKEAKVNLAPDINNLIEQVINAEETKKRKKVRVQV